VCYPGYSTGKTDWINFDGRDCQMPISFHRFWAGLATISLSLATLQALRFMRKTYLDSRDKDRKLKLLLQKPPFLVGLHMLNANAAILILSTKKFLWPETLMIDPIDNPAFFVYFFQSDTSGSTSDQKLADLKNKMYFFVLGISYATAGIYT